MIDRRSFLAGALGAFASGPLSASEVAALRFGPASPLSFDALKQRARDLARAPYIPPTRPAPEVLQQIDYDAHGKIRFKTDLALWANGPSEFPVTFFHLGRYFQSPVRMHVVEGGEAREILYDSAYFDMPANSPAHKLPPNS
ncbi:MAG: glucan biosynthesis protein, partial [Microvirga sp.]